MSAANAVFCTSLLNTDSALLREVLLAQRRGEGCLPPMLGLDVWTYQAMLRFCGEASELPLEAHHGHLRQTLLDLRRDEWQDIRGLLLSGIREHNVLTDWWAAIVAAGCLGGNHLWRDLGLPNRQALGTLLLQYFPGVAQKNVRDMRWKKFFYKQLCEAEGGYVCRSPTCEQCTLYAECFGEET